MLLLTRRLFVGVQGVPYRHRGTFPVVLHAGQDASSFGRSRPTPAAQACGQNLSWCVLLLWDPCPVCLHASAFVVSNRMQHALSVDVHSYADVKAVAALQYAISLAKTQMTASDACRQHDAVWC